MSASRHSVFGAMADLLFFITVHNFQLTTAALAEPITVTDAIGRTLILPDAPSRIISLAPSVTEILFALGLDEEIVGVTTACDFPARALEKPSVGGSISPDLEIMLRLKPDLILGIKGLQRPGLTDELDRLGLPIYLTNPSSLDLTLRDIRLIGQMVDRIQEAEALAQDIESHMEEIQVRVHGYPRTKILYVLWNDPLMTVTRSSFIGEMIEIAGGENIASEGLKGYIQIGMERVLAQDPEVVIFASEMGEGTAMLERQRWSRWKQLTAVKDQRLHILNSDLLHRPGPRLGDAIESLAAVLHPEQTVARDEEVLKSR